MATRRVPPIFHFSNLLVESALKMAYRLHWFHHKTRIPHQEILYCCQAFITGSHNRLPIACLVFHLRIIDWFTKWLSKHWKIHNIMLFRSSILKICFCIRIEEISFAFSKRVVWKQTSRCSQSARMHHLLYTYRSQLHKAKMIATKCLMCSVREVMFAVVGVLHSALAWHVWQAKRSDRPRYFNPVAPVNIYSMTLP